MLNSVSALRGFDVQAKDGALGTVSDFLFDDSTWKVRWVVVDTGRWLTGRKVLVHPSAVLSAEYEARALNVGLTKAQVADSPDVRSDSPVSRQMQNSLYGYYGCDPLWGGGMFASGPYGGGMYRGGKNAIALPLSAPAYFGAGAATKAERGDVNLDDGDPHLRSTAEVTGYDVHATDGTIGRVQDFLVESEGWGVRYLVIDTANWWAGQHVLISPYAVKEVEWSDHHVRVDMARDKVRSSPSWNPADRVTGEYGRRLHNHYNWPGHGW